MSLWFKELPSGWEEAPLKTRLARNDGGVWGEDPDGGDADTIVLRSTEQRVDGAWNIEAPAVRKLSKREADGGRLEVDDLVVTKSSGSELHIGKTSLVTSEVAALNACYSNFMQRLRVDERTEPRFVHYWMNNELCREQFAYLSNSTSGLANLNGTVLGTARLAFPSRTDQEHIANFLDEQTARIDTLIAEKERLASSVRAYEQAEISRLLTHGVNDAPLEKTGKSFIPKAPAGWRVTAFKRALISMGQGWSPQCENQPAQPGEWGVLKVGCVNGTRFDASENKALPPELQPDLTCVLRKGDLLMSRANTKELVGMAALVDEDYPQLMLCDKLYRLELRPDWVSPAYAALALRSDTSRQQIELGASGASSSMQNISQDVVRELVVAFPSLDEQHLIVQKANQIQETCRNLAEHVHEHIVRLREYRSSLISAAVTGQLDLSTFKKAVQ